MTNTTNRIVYVCMNKNHSGFHKVTRDCGMPSTLIEHILEEDGEEVTHENRNDPERP